ncbi:unnamed protein product [Nezara viridula]|uniref:G-protein coupled receptors family 1 profile domain-containing protein n=1 Tax=Nezara viridula TaxID=85310 RepID=A0A9P0HAV2_NEZVI|nr:unnamed protein product [Nezara viridula]
MTRGETELVAGYWPLGVEWCNVYVTSDVLACSASIMHMCGISMGRYFGIRNPLKTRQSSKRMVGFKIALVWLVSILVSSSITLLGIHESSNIMPVPRVCVINNRAFWIFGSLVAFYIPMLIMGVTYGLTVHLLRRKAQFVAAVGEEEQSHLRRLGGRYRRADSTRQPHRVSARASDRYRMPALAERIPEVSDTWLSPLPLHSPPFSLTPPPPPPPAHPNKHWSFDLIKVQEGSYCLTRSQLIVPGMAKSSNEPCIKYPTAQDDRGRCLVVSGQFSVNQPPPYRQPNKICLDGLKDFRSVLPRIYGFLGNRKGLFQVPTAPQDWTEYEIEILVIDLTSISEQSLCSCAARTEGDASAQAEEDAKNNRRKTLRLQLNATTTPLNLRLDYFDDLVNCRFLANRRQRQAMTANVVATEQKASKVLGLVFLTFVLCWAPFFILNIIFAACPACFIPPHVVDICLWAGYLSSNINPIIYTIFNRTFREAFIRLLKCQCDDDYHRPLRYRSVTEGGQRTLPSTLSPQGSLTPASASSYLRTPSAFPDTFCIAASQ